MSIQRTIKCNFCTASFSEQGFNLGFPGWGHIVGLINKETGEDTAHVCPDCMKRLVNILNNNGEALQ
jgi:hypothetical protein